MAEEGETRAKLNGEKVSMEEVIARLQEENDKNESEAKGILKLKAKLEDEIKEVHSFDLADSRKRAALEFRNFISLTDARRTGERTEARD